MLIVYIMLNKKIIKFKIGKLFNTGFLSFVKTVIREIKVR